MKTYISRSKQEVATNFSKYLYEFISARESVHIALSGGSTPKIVFDELGATYKTKIDWQQVHLYWGDERCVKPTDAESNYKMTVDHLLSKIAIPTENIHRVKGEDMPQTEAERYAKLLDEKLPKSAGMPQFDLVILGLGDDGHTASVFPHEIDLWDSKNYCEVATHPESGQKRVSITGDIINNSEEVAFLVTGAGKVEKVKEIINKEGDFQKYPGSLVVPTSGNLNWFLDEDAAAGITSKLS